MEQRNKERVSNNDMDFQLAKTLKEIENTPFQHILPQVNKIKALLQNGCNVNGQNENGDTLLHILVKSGQFRGHNTIEAGDNQNPRPENVLDLAYLMQYHPNPLIENKQGLTPAMLAAQLKQTSEWQFLTAYEQKYTAQETAQVLSAFYLMSDLYTKDVHKGQTNPTILRSLARLQGYER